MGRIAVSRVDSAEEFSARDRGWLVLRDAPLAEVAAVVHRWYGLELRAQEDSQLAGRRLTATFTGDDVNELITTLELALDASARVQGDTIVLSVRRGTTRR
jgi:ferric-dicitrate binding protein FerR (iron transport regulator)